MLIVCSACSCLLQSEADLINHRDAEHPELSHRCNLCTKVFETVSVLTTSDYSRLFYYNCLT